MVQLQGEAKQQYVASMFARIAGRYDLMNTLITGGMHLSWKRKTAQITAQGLSGRALDIASGTGDLTLALAALPQIKQAVGLDLLPEMVTLAKAKAARTAMLFSRTNTLLSIPMLYAMVSAQNIL